MNAKKVREFSGLTQEQIARAVELSLSGWQKREEKKDNASMKIDLRIEDKLISSILQVAHSKGTTLTELVCEMVSKYSTQFLKSRFNVAINCDNTES